MELLQVKKQTRPETVLETTIGEKLIPINGEVMTGYYVLGNRNVRDLVIATGIAGVENMEPENMLIHLGNVPRGATLNLVANGYREMWERHKKFEAIGYRAYNTPEMLAHYRHLYEEEPECLLAVKPRFGNRIYVVKESLVVPGLPVMSSGIPISEYNYQYDETMLAIGRPLLYDEIEYLPLEG